VGKLRGINLTGTEYILYDNGLSPNKSSSRKHSTDTENFRRELAAIVYVSRDKKKQDRCFLIGSLTSDLTRYLRKRFTF
jgi:hypothetical protein